MCVVFFVASVCLHFWLVSCGSKLLPPRKVALPLQHYNTTTINTCDPGFRRVFGLGTFLGVSDEACLARAMHAKLFLGGFLAHYDVGSAFDTYYTGGEPRCFIRVFTFIRSRHKPCMYV